MASIGDIAKLPPVLQAVAEGKRVTVDKHGGLVQIDKKLEQDSAELRQERKRRNFADKWRQAAAVYENINLTEGCRVGKPDAKKLKSECAVDKDPYGRVSRQLIQGIPLDQKGSRVVDNDFWKERVPVNGQIPSISASQIKDHHRKDTIKGNFKRTKGIWGETNPKA